MTVKFLLALGMLATVGCTMDSTIEFNRPPESFESTTAKSTILSMHQGGVVNAVTGGGYKANVSVGVQLNRAQALTSSGYKVQVNFPGQSAQ
ncbi:MAG: hypothetical protein EOP09_17660 [Proteobacteria bacterium]|nr:MAG: hypothetical protein EOP09_17660 [Pseudomonadota bacterium]